MAPLGSRTATAQLYLPRIITPSMRAWPPTWVLIAPSSEKARDKSLFCFAMGPSYLFSLSNTSLDAPRQAGRRRTAYWSNVARSTRANGLPQVIFPSGQVACTQGAPASAKM